MTARTSLRGAQRKWENSGRAGPPPAACRSRTGRGRPLQLSLRAAASSLASSQPCRRRPPGQSGRCRVAAGRPPLRGASVGPLPSRCLQEGRGRSPPAGCDGPWQRVRECVHGRSGRVAGHDPRHACLGQEGAGQSSPAAAADTCAHRRAGPLLMDPLAQALPSNRPTVGGEAAHRRILRPGHGGDGIGDLQHGEPIRDGARRAADRGLDQSRAVRQSGPTIPDVPKERAQITGLGRFPPGGPEARSASSCRISFARALT